MNDKPIVFEPFLKETIWGNFFLSSIKKKEKKIIGESWEISEVPNHISQAISPPWINKSLKDIRELHPKELLGNENARYFKSFPLLTKFISTSDELSIQVHPNDELAKQYNSFGKTEMWYIIDAQPNSFVIDGFKKSIHPDNLSPSHIKEMIDNKNFEDFLNKIYVKPGDVFFIPAGKIHAIGKGITLAEIQQSSDTTYRLHDWNRVDKNKKPRELHIDKGIRAINPQLYHEPITYQTHLNTPIPLIHNPYFSVNVLKTSKSFLRNAKDINSFIIYMCIDGDLEINGQKLSKCQSVLIPAQTKNIDIQSQKESTVLEIYIDQSIKI